MKYKGFLLPALLGVLFALSAALRSQTLTKSDRELSESMLRDADADIRKHYYDPSLHGIDWQNRVQEARKNITTAQSASAAVSEVAALLDSLHDSHTLGDAAQAYVYLNRAATGAKANGQTVNRFWFEDGPTKWEKDAVEQRPRQKTAVEAAREQDEELSQ